MRVPRACEVSKDCRTSAGFLEEGAPELSPEQRRAQGQEASRRKWPGLG